MASDPRTTTSQRTIELSSLEFDHLNPRLPEWVERDDEEIFEHILEHYALDELIDSFLDNGYFEAERLIVIESDSTPGNYIVVEGNRRLAALKYLQQQYHGAADSDALIPKGLIEELLHIPCLTVNSREEVNTYLAYRHIGGMKTWGAEAKARFILRMTRELVAEGDIDPFKTIGRKVGSNAAGIRNLYSAIAVLEYAKDELNLNVDFLQYNRFGVWTRCMNSPEIKDYIGLGSPKEYGEIVEKLNLIDDSRLLEVIRDLSKRSDGRAAIVNDSRLVTNYGRVLNDEKARRALREHENLPLAIQILSNQGYAERISILANQVSILVDEISSEDIDIEIAIEASRPARKLYGSARTLNATLSDIVDHED